MFNDIKCLGKGGIYMAIPEDFTYKNIENFYNRVRSCLSINNALITDEEIDYPENAPTAERRVKARITNWQELEEDKAELFYSCIVYMTCYALCSTAKTRTGMFAQQSTPNLTIKVADFAINNFSCEHYLQLIDDLVSEISGESAINFIGFTISKRGEYLWPKFPST